LAEQAEDEKKVAERVAVTYGPDNAGTSVVKAVHPGKVLMRTLGPLPQWRYECSTIGHLVLQIVQLSLEPWCYVPALVGSLN